MKSLIEHQVYGLGRRLDRFLDELEGREETVPEAWIEHFEMLEEQYGEWAVQAERKVLEDGWRTQGLQRQENGQGQFLGVERMPSTVSKMSIADEDPEADRDALARSTPLAELDGEGILVANDVGAENRIDSTIGPVEAMSTKDISSENGENSRPMTARRSRHVPIIYNHEQYSQIFTDSEHEKAEPTAQTSKEGSSLVSDPTSKKPEVEDTTASSSHKVKKRAAFFNGDIEKSNGLKKGKPPPIVRPFEHASNAFTRLFKRDSKSPDQGRRNSVKSANSDGKTSAGNKREKAVYGDGIGGYLPETRDVGTVSQQSGKVNADAASMSTGTGSSSAGAKRSSTSSWTKNEKYAPDFKNPRRLDLNRNTYLDMVGGSPELRRSEDYGRSRSQSVRSGNAKKRVSKEPPETYRPSGLLSSPFHSASNSMDARPRDEFPEDWPLSSAGTTPMDTASPTKEKDMGRMGGILGITPEKDDDDSSPETGEPKQPLASDAFDRMFVQTFPAGKDVSANNLAGKARPQTAAKAEGIAAAEETIRRLQRERDYAEERAGIAERVGKEVIAKRLEMLDLGLPRPVSTVQEEEREIVPGTSFYFDDEVKNADPAGYSATTASEGLARASSSSGATEAATVNSGLPSRSKSMPPVSPMMLKLKIPSSESHEENVPISKDIADGTKVALIKRASVTSIESHPRSELKSIDVPRRSSISSLGSGVRSAPQTPRDSAPVSAVTPRDSAPPSAVERNVKGTPTSPMDYKNMAVFPSPLSVPPRGSSLQNSPGSPVSLVESREASPIAARHRREESTPLASRDAEPGSPITDDYDVAAAPLNKTMSKRKYKDVPTAQLRNKASTPAKEQMPLKPGEDNFDRHVSQVLDRVHAPIRFKSRPGAETPLPSRTEQRAPGPKSTKSMPGKVAEKMTLAPAEPSPKKATTAEPEVKLYHLTQAGRSEPIKLFVRLVGEGERVMVRVGGGWADLADYLRQYAEHHGSRTVSEGGLEVQTLSTTPSSATSGPGSATALRRTFSGPAAEPKSARTPVTPLAAYKGPVDENWLSGPQPRFTMGDSSPSDTEASPIDGFQAMQTQRSTPKSVTSSRGSRPSTADASSRPWSRQGLPRLDTDSAGLAGPTSVKMKADLPEQKARWVEGMIERVNKSASAEKSREEREKYFGDIGKAGGTRRVVFRSSSGMGGEK